MSTEARKAVISNRIYFKTNNDDELKTIMRALTYKIEKKSGSKGKFNQIEIIKGYKILPNNMVSIPQGRLDLLPCGMEVVDKRIWHPVPFPLPIFPLREGQQVVYDETDDTCFINALVGWGKTFTALQIARKLGQKTLVVTHTTALRDQWRKEIRTLFNMEPGVIGSGMFDIEDHAIVVGNVQTVTKLLPQLAKEFGTLILDEAHHCPATTFSDIIDSSHARYRIGLSGTMQRTDGKQVLFRDYFGSVIHTPPQAHTLDPVIKLVPTGIKLPPHMSHVEKLNHLLYDPDYQEFISNIAKVQVAKGHSVLIIANRVEFLTNVKDIIGENCVLITGLQSDFDERTELLRQVEEKEKMCLAGSTQIFSEGVSCNTLSCVILAVPSGNLINLEQIIGRIMRLADNKLKPLVLDIGFSSHKERADAAKRLGFYQGKGWEIANL